MVTSLGSTSWAPCQVVCGAARMAPTQPEAPGQQRLDKAAAKAKTAWLSSWMLDGRLLTQAFHAPLGVRGRGWLARETREHDGVAVQPSARGDFFRSANAGRIGDTVRRAAAAREMEHCSSLTPLRVFVVSGMNSSLAALQRGGASRMLAPPPNSSPRGGSRAPPGFAGMDPYLLKAFML